MYMDHPPLPVVHGPSLDPRLAQVEQSGRSEVRAAEGGGEGAALPAHFAGPLQVQTAARFR